jgi:hypothetical protein
MIFELPLTILGSAMLFKKIMKNKELQEWIAMFRESKDILRDLLEEYKAHNGKEKKVQSI